MRPNCRTFVLSSLLYWSCSDERIHLAHSFQLCTYNKRFCCSTRGTAQIVPTSQRHGLGKNLNLNRGKRSLGIDSTTTLLGNKNEIIQEGKETGKTKLLQDQELENPLASFFSSLPSIELPQFVLDDANDEEVRCLQMKVKTNACR